jgi:hypothetical protein
MRFSLKWMLAAMVYVALAASAVGLHSRALADVVWMLNIAALLFTLMVMIGGASERRSRATGFAIFMGSYIFASCLVYNRLPATRVFQANGYEISASGSAYAWTEPLRPGGEVTRLDATASLYVAHATSALACGFFGAYLGPLAFRRGDRSESATAV